jgi:hypothetical protein
LIQSDAPLLNLVLNLVKREWGTNCRCVAGRIACRMEICKWGIGRCN